MRRLAAFVAILCVLAHAAALVRHSAMTVRLALPDAVAALEADLARPSAICHGARDGTASPVTVSEDSVADRDTGRAPQRGDARCPACCGPAAAFAIAAPEKAPPLIIRRTVAMVAFWPTQDTRRDHHLRLRPPSRAPPASA